MPVVSDYTALLQILDTPYASWNAHHAVGTPVFVTYSFTETADLPVEEGQVYEAFDETFREFFRSALEVFSANFGVTFVEVTGYSMLNAFGMRNTQEASWANFPVALDNITYGANLAMGLDGNFPGDDHARQLIWHEVAHALGLKHPFEGGTTLDPELDNTNNTVMSYNYLTWSVLQLGHLDVEALRYLYGSPNQKTGWSWSYDAGIFTVNGSSADDTIIGVIGENHLDGGQGDDTLAGREKADTLSGGDGADALFGFSGNDILSGGDSDDMLDGSYGNDILSGDRGNDNLRGGDGDDALSGGRGADTLDGGYENDTLSGGREGDLLLGGGGDDALFGARGNDKLEGGDGSDTLDGGRGADTLDGGEGNDALSGGRKSDQLFGGGGDDALSGGRGADTLDGGDGNDTLSGGRKSDLLLGGRGDDALFGDRGADTLDGGDGSDTLEGGRGSDHLSGGIGNDFLSGGRNADILVGGFGADTMTGGHGSDEFVFSQADFLVQGDEFHLDFGQINVITDFQNNRDYIRIMPDLGYSFENATLSQVASDVLIEFNGGTGVSILLQGMSLSWIDANDFLFGP